MGLLVNLDQTVKVQSQVLKVIPVVLDQMEIQVGPQFPHLTKKEIDHTGTLLTLVWCCRMSW